MVILIFAHTVILCGFEGIYRCLLPSEKHLMFEGSKTGCHFCVDILVENSDM